MFKLILFFTIFTLSNLCKAESSAYKWNNLTYTQKYYYIVGYIDGHFALNATIPNEIRPQAGYINIPTADQMEGTIQNMDKLYSEKSNKDIWWSDLMPIAISKTKSASYGYKIKIHRLRQEAQEPRKAIKTVPWVDES